MTRYFEKEWITENELRDNLAQLATQDITYVSFEAFNKLADGFRWIMSTHDLRDDLQRPEAIDKVIARAKEGEPGEVVYILGYGID